MTADEAINAINESEDKNVEKACEALRNYNGDIRDCLLDVVASLCNVTKENILYDTHYVSSNARKFYWYVYRQLTGECFTTMSERTKGALFSAPNTIGKACVNMEMIISQNNVWTRRWEIMRRIINEVGKARINDDIVLKVTAPIGVKVEIKQE